ncbi:SGNH/GDSL hydrolase family protein [Mangrovibacterium marinum]|uniref:Lysophospholipase L1-like esterase n=1 Tax=Mangrovibacterium marinum TaxID=1639118 RepID=A0A2T5C4H5_9BACT|nr:SGNH/GDSL hydrolase family protein [Mangrovibacterium marinum]PTN09749.1 lysophospholipase L1-like esterase [Mangrovibacterium marinum]
MNNFKPNRRHFLKLATIAGVGTAGLATACANSSRKPEKPERENLTFLFQGDSITDGNRGRTDDPNHILGHGYCFAVSSRIGADFPEAGFQFINRGISGNTVTDLSNRWQADALDLKPDVLSLLVGINDVNALVEGSEAAIDLETFEATYRALLSQCRAQNPELLIVLGLPFFFASGWRKDFYEQWHPLTLQRAEVVKRIAADFDAVLVDYPRVFDEAQQRAPIDYWIWDGVHPTVFGHELMAREWIKQVSERLQFLNVYKQ